MGEHRHQAQVLLGVNKLPIVEDDQNDLHEKRCVSGLALKMTVEALMPPHDRSASRWTWNAYLPCPAGTERREWEESGTSATVVLGGIGLSTVPYTASGRPYVSRNLEFESPRELLPPAVFSKFHR